MEPNITRTSDRTNASTQAPKALPTWTPAVDVRATETETFVEIELAGVRPEDAVIEIDRGKLTVSAKRAAVAGLWPESELKRTFQLSDDIDEERVAAHFEAGLLTLTLPRRAAPTRKVAIRVGK